MLLLNASRIIFTRSAGTPGGKTIGRPNSSAASTTFTRRRNVVSSFVLVHQFIEQRHIFDPRIAFGAGLVEHAYKILFPPGNKRLTGKKRVYRKRPTHHFATLHGEIDVLTGDIA